MNAVESPQNIDEKRELLQAWVSSNEEWMSRPGKFVVERASCTSPARFPAVCLLSSFALLEHLSTRPSLYVSVSLSRDNDYEAPMASFLPPSTGLVLLVYHLVIYSVYLTLSLLCLFLRM